MARHLAEPEVIPYLILSCESVCQGAQGVKSLVYSAIGVFAEVWLKEFYFLQFRSDSQHAVCTTCVRHRQMIRGLGAHLRARKSQIELFHDHLKAQYSDRILYWEKRAMSRLRGNIVCIIADGMDQMKFSLPRTPITKGKEFSSFQKVKLHVSAAICHGRFVLFTVGLPTTKKDGNMSCELLAHCLTLLERQGQCLSTTQLFLQHDNTCREFKNNHGVRWMIGQVFSKNIDRIQASYLRSGHTHGDVDQCFGQLSKYLLKCRDLQTPDDVKTAITGFLSQCKMPFEGERHCVFLNEPRDWYLGCVGGLHWG